VTAGTTYYYWIKAMGTDGAIIKSSWSEAKFLDIYVTAVTTYYCWIKARETDGTVTNSSAVSATIQNDAPALTSAPHSTPDLNDS
jgi:hypothetical protein